MTVKMQHAGKDFMADVHPDEVENYRAAGWQEVEGEAQQAEASGGSYFVTTEPKRRGRKSKGD